MIIDIFIVQFLNLSKYLLKRLLIGLFNFFTVFLSLFSVFHAQNVPERSVVTVIPRTPRKISVMTVSAPSWDSSAKISDVKFTGLVMVI